MKNILTVICCIFFIASGFKEEEHNTAYAFPLLKYFPKMPVNPENIPTVAGVKLGRHLFYDPILSRDSNMSCSDCHKQKFAFSDSPEKFSRGNNGTLTSRNAMPLFNLAWYPSLFWDGNATSIEEQIFHPVRNYDEMNLNWKAAAYRLNKNSFYNKMFRDAFGNKEVDSVMTSNAIAQFLRTLISHSSRYDRIIGGEGHFTKEEYAGYLLMNDQTNGGCLHCHTTDFNALGTTLNFSNNGLDSIKDATDYKDKGRGGVTGNKNDNGKFMIPTLRNVAVTAPYMHDGRFNTLEEVLDFYSEGINVCANIDSKMEFANRKGAMFTADEKNAIILFLNTLTDSVFISNPEFGNPFSKKFHK